MAQPDSQVKLTLREAARATGGELTLPAGLDDQAHFHGLSTDSRVVRPGQAYLAIHGERLDGHAYAAAAALAGARLLVVHRDVGVPDAAVLRVADTTTALGALATAWRERVAPRIVGLTGSVGKTTTKELLRNILAQLGSTHATWGNYNNHIGLPLTLLATPEDCRFVVAEMGMNAPGEIGTLARIARPEVALITALAPVHLEGLGSMEAIAAAKAELLAALSPEHLAIVPGSEPLLTPYLRSCQAAVLTFGSSDDCDIQLTHYRWTGKRGAEIAIVGPGGEIEIVLPLPGRHNAENALAAAATAHALEVPWPCIAKGLTTPPELGHRSSLFELGDYHVMDDCYNASPVATKAALATLSELAGSAPMVAVLGEMLELGAAAVALHREVGAFAATLPNLRLLVTCGALGQELAQGALDAGLPPQRVLHVDDAKAAGEVVAERAEAGGWLLFKGSRGSRMELALESFTLCQPPATP